MGHKQRIIWIDNAKGIAMILVIIGHTYSGLSGIWNFSFVYGIHLVMFFLLSGFMIIPQKLTTEYVNKKFSRLMVPYFATCTAVLLMDLINSGIFLHDISLQTLTDIVAKDLLRGFFASGSIKKFGPIDLGTRIGAIWFLPAMFFALVFFQKIFTSINNDLLSGSIFCSMAIFSVIITKFIWFPFSILSAMLALPFLWLGYEINHYRVLEKICWHHYLIAQLVLIYGIHFGYCSVNFASGSLADWIISIPVSISGCLLIYLLSIINKKGRILSYIGRNSIVILCIHLFFLVTINPYLQTFLDFLDLKGNSRIWAKIIIHILLPIINSSILFTVQKGIRSFYKYIAHRWKEWAPVQSISDADQKQIQYINAAQGFFILLIILGSFKIDKSLLDIIYSCHIVGIEFLSGYMYNKNNSMAQKIVRICKTLLLPYFFCGVFDILFSFRNLTLSGILVRVRKYLLGFSSVRTVCPDALPVGPIFIILLLFCTEFVYTLINLLCSSKRIKVFVIMCISLVGFHLGKEGYWLPWSLDLACYSLLFYGFGVLIRKHNLLQNLHKNHFIYFIISPIWVYMIYSGSMDLVLRKYGKYGMVIIGSLSGVLLIYKLTAYLSDNLLFTGGILRLIGTYSMFVIIIHQLFGNRINHWFEIINIKQEYSWNMIAATSLQLAAGILIGFIMKKIFKKLYTQCM